MAVETTIGAEQGNVKENWTMPIRNRITILREHEGKTITAIAEYTSASEHLPPALAAEGLMRGWVCEVFIPDSSYHQRRATASDAYGVLGDMLDIAIEAYDDVRAGR